MIKEHSRGVNDGAGFEGRVEVVVRCAKTGRIKQRVVNKNLFTTSGKARLGALISGSSVAYPSHIAIATGSTAPTVSDTALSGEVARKALALRTDSAGVITLKAFFSKSDANGSTIASAGVLDAAASGTLLNHALISPTIAKTSSDTITVTWTYTIVTATS